MTVRELQDKLGTLDPALEVFCYSEDAPLAGTSDGPLVFAVLAVTMIQGEQPRLAEGTPSLTMGQRAAPAAIAVIEMTTDF